VIGDEDVADDVVDKDDVENDSVVVAVDEDEVTDVAADVADVMAVVTADVDEDSDEAEELEPPEDDDPPSK
jgi:hypothetical protein